MGAAGVVDEAVDPAQRLRGARDEVLHLLGIGDVGPLGVDDAQLLGGGQDLLLVAGADRDPGALGDQFAGDRGAEPFRPSCDERPTPFEAEVHFSRR